MGLAASQARLLFITMRQNDVSAKMQKISNDKLILARDEEEVSEKYNKMLNAKKYEAVDGVNLSYSALMAQGKTLTDANGSIILDTSSYSELQKNGYIKNNEESGTLNLGDKSSFVANMAGLSAEKAALAELSLDDYIQKNASTYPTLAANPTKPDLVSEKQDISVDKNTVVGSGYGYGEAGFKDSYSSAGAVVKEATSRIKNDIGNFISNLSVKAINAFSGYPNDIKSKVESAANTAKAATSEAALTDKGSGNKNTSEAKSIVGNSTGFYVARWYCYDWYCSWGSNAVYNKDATANKFYEEFAKALGQDTNGPITFKDVTTDNSESIKKWDKEHANAETAYKKYMKDNGLSDAEAAKITKYQTMYENLNGKPWVKKDLDASAIANGIANGIYFVEGSNPADLVTEVSDKDTQAKAEAYYKQEMAKINRKEKEQDTQLQKLQTEYQGLTSDYESVKSILNANIQKSFTYCQQG